jgi:serine/threonine-protein kinase
MGMYIYYCLQDYERALVELEQARAQAPNRAFIIQAIGLVRRRQGNHDESVPLLLQAAQIDPLNQDIWTNLAWSYRGLRRFADAQAMFDRALAIAPNDPTITGRKADAYVADGDLASAQRVLGSLDPQLRDDPFFSVLTLLVFQRKFDEAIAKVSAGLDRDPSPPVLLAAFAHEVIGALHMVSGRKEQAKPFLQKAEAELLAIKNQGNASPEVLDGLLKVHALLGEREAVERESAEHIAALKKDRWRGPSTEADAARAWSILGDRERVIPILERLLVQPYADSLTPALLRLDPIWDPIRDDPRFQKLAAGKP